jgi:hypothetical protein
MKCSSSVLIGVVTANQLGFGSALDEICQFFSYSSAQRDMMCHKSATESSWHIVTSLTRPQ